MERLSKYVRNGCVRVLRCGPIPTHVAFIMDGNRRFARKMNIECARGHAMGFDKLKETLEWCLDLGVQMVTVYAFSIENFKRSPQEVQALMKLAREQFLKLLEKSDMIQRNGICVRVLGDVSLLPRDLQEAIAKAVTLSRNNTRAVLNVCFAYTSRHEMTLALDDIRKGVRDGLLLESDISEDLIQRALYTEDAPEPELLLRTSGEVRLSDFLLWQSAYSCLHFTGVLWPEFSFRDLLWCMLHFQRNHSELQAARMEGKIAAANRILQQDTAAIQQSHPGATVAEVQQMLQANLLARKQRVETFLQRLRCERMLFFERLAPTVQ